MANAQQLQLHDCDLELTVLHAAPQCVNLRKLAWVLDGVRSHTAAPPTHMQVDSIVIMCEP